MKLFYALIISLLLYTFDGSAKPFSPIVTNYSVSDYNSANQNWAVSQDRQGRLYFGNDSGLLEYDGANWQLYKLPTNGNIRSIYVDQKLDRIYVGSFEEFGFFCRDEFGLLHYTSLKDQTEDFEFRNDEIWNIIELDGDIIFQSFGSLFTYDGETVAGDRVNTLPLNLMLLNGVCYSQIMNKGLNIYSNNQFTEIISRSQLNNSEVVAILPHPKGMLLLTENSGGFIYDEHKIISPWNEECHEELTQYGINRAIVSPDSTYIVGTLSNGIYAYNSNGELLWSENTDNQLANNTILGLYCDADGNIWVALDNGISYINTKSPMYIFKPSSRSIGMIYDVDIDDEQIHIVSNQGVFNYSDDKLSALPNLEEQAWTLFRDGDQLLCGHNKGSIEISSNGSTKSISDIRGGLCFKRVELYDESILMQGTYTYLNIYRKNSDGKWQFSNSITSFSHMARNIEVDHRGNIWIEHMRKGIFKIRLDQKLEEVIEFKHYISLDDSDKTVSSKLFKINGRIVLTDGVKFYTYDDIEDSIIPYNDMNEQLSGMKPVYRVSQIDDHKYWFVSEQAIYLVNCDANTFTILDRIAYKTFGSFSTELLATHLRTEDANVGP
ncbi:MAG: two-component regulator propeller domain-containing protein [Rikenellaceae bacterium]